jgi:hypothetical protein
VSCREKTPIFVYLAWRLWKSVLRLAVGGMVFPVVFSASEGAGV